MGLSSTVSEKNGDFSRKLPIFPTSVHYLTPLTGFHLQLGIAARVKKLERWATRRSKMF